MGHTHDKESFLKFIKHRSRLKNAPRSPNICACPHTWRLYLEKESFQVWLRILRWVYLGFSGSALNAVNKHPEKREKKKDTHKREGFVEIKAGMGVMWMPAEECWVPTEAGRGKECILLDFGPLKMLLNFWPPETWEEKCLLFQATKFAVKY